MTFSELYFSFEGRVSRQTYWLKGFLPAVVGTIVMVGIASRRGIGIVLFIIWMLFMMFALAAVEVKRWHDLNKSGVWYFIGFVPFIGGLWKLVECGFLPGTEGENDYGPDPLGRDDDFMDIE